MHSSVPAFASRLADLRALAPIGARGHILFRNDARLRRASFSRIDIRIRTYAEALGPPTQNANRSPEMHRKRRTVAQKRLLEEGCGTQIANRSSEMRR